MKRETVRTLQVAAITVFAVLVVEAVAMETFLRTQGFSAKDKPSWMETWFAQHARYVSTPGGARELKNPSPVTENSMAEAREHWVAHCSMCHGIDGRGDTVFGRSMYPPVPNVNEAQTQRKADGELFYIISNGVRLTGMPAFGGEDSPESIWNLVSFIRRLPRLSPEELRQMKQFAGEGTEQRSGQQNGDDAAGANERSQASGGNPVKREEGMKGHNHQSGGKPHHH